MPHTLESNWWAIVLRGVFAILFGVLTFAVPGFTLFALIVLFGAYAIVDGVLNIIASVRGMRAHERWGALLLEGLVGIAAGLITFAWPGLTTLALTFLIAGWALVTGVLEIVAAVRLRKLIHGEWALALSGVVSIALGLLLAYRPVTGTLALVYWIGAYAIVFGVLLVVLGVRLHSSGTHHTTMRPAEGM